MKLILLVEDEYGNAEILDLMLQAEGYRVAVASNGKGALELLAGEKPAVILSDYMMPFMNGAELGLAVRASSVLKDIPFVVMSGTNEAVIRERFSDYDAFVGKPYSGEALLKLVAHLVQHGRPPRDAAGERDAAVDRTMQQLMSGLRLPR